ncbi:MAG: HepT-like ribonuclease domain-containing protein, partial [Desulfurobacteriaceae bacterium]
MSKRSVEIYLLDILDEIKRIERFFSSVSSENELKSNELVYYATLKCLENIGEAVKHIPESIKNLYPQVPWKQIV